MPSIPKYLFIKRLKIADAFFDLDTKSTDEKKSFTRRIQTMNDIAAFYKLREASRRKKLFKWNKVERTADDIISYRDTEKTKITELLSFSLFSLFSFSSALISPRLSQD
jgi:hypothetical protein